MESRLPTEAVRMFPTDVHRSGAAGATSRAPSRFGAFSRLWTASALTNLGDGIVRITMPLLALGLGGSAATIALVAFAGRVPWLIGAIPAGLLVDRADRRWVAIGANGLRLIVLVGLGIAHLVGVLNVPLIIAATLVVALAEVVADTATQALIPMVIPPAGLVAANQRVIGTETAANEFSGPALGGVVVALGALTAIGSTVGLFLFAVALLLSLRGTFRAARGIAAGAEMERRSGWRADLGEGMGFIWRTPVLRGVVLAVVAMSLAWSAQQALLVSYLVAPGPGGLSAWQYGLVMGGVGAGGVLGVLSVGTLSRRFGLGPVLAVDVVGSILLVAVPTVSHDALLIAGSTVFAGFASALWTVLVSALRQRITPPDLIGRVSGAYRTFSMGSMAVGAGLAALLVQFADIRLVFLAFTVTPLLAVIPFSLWLYPNATGASVAIDRPA